MLKHQLCPPPASNSLNGPTWVGHPLPVQLAVIGEGEGDGRTRSGRCKV